MSLTFGGGNIGIIIEKTVGTAHTTNVYVVPIWLIVAILALIVLPIWMARRRSRDSE